MSFELKAVPPKGQYDDKLMRSLLQRAMKNTSQQGKRRYEKTVKTWKKRPKFRVKTSTRRGELVSKVYTDDALFAIIDQGAEPHRIAARRTRFLRFQNEYTAKTTPNVIGSKESAGKTGEWVTTQEVNHPGHEARNFSKIIGKEAQTKFQAETNRSLGEWVRRTRG